ncbi:MAG: hypothetical protein O9268_09660 [Novosphingobium sp.]|nr:hypothetical protein [Novosphingobium sp.]MCZ8232445.1 hypothetical protein [Novosphingobium sp.]
MTVSKKNRIDPQFMVTLPPGQVSQFDLEPAGSTSVDHRLFEQRFKLLRMALVKVFPEQ